MGLYKMKRSIFFFLLLFSLLIPTTAHAQVHERPVSTATLSPAPTSPASGLTIYTDPVTVTIQATADTGYSIANIYYRIDGGQQQTYSSPFTVAGSGTHSMEFWSIDNAGIEEFPHKSQSFVVSPQQGVINSILQNVQTGSGYNVYVNFDDFASYTAQLFNNDCHNDPGRSFAIYNANTGELVASPTHNQGGRCFSLGNPYQTIVFPTGFLPSGTYFIYYHGGTNQDWITNTFSYTAPVPHEKPSTTSTISPSPSTPGNGLIVYPASATITLEASADIGYTIANTFYRVDGGTQQTYSTPFTITGSGTHTVEYWSVDNSGLEETSHKTRTLLVNPQQGIINSIIQNSTTINVSVSFENFEAYTSQLFNNDCHNDPGRVFAIYNAVTGELVSSATHSQGGRCFSFGSPVQTLVFPPMQLASGTYFINYHGGDNSEWITENFVYTEPAPVHEKPVTTDDVSPNPTILGQGLEVYEDPVTVTLSATADTGFSIASTYYKVDGGVQQTYSGPFTISGSGTHGIEFWSIDNTGLEENNHKSRTIIIEPQQAVIRAIIQGGVTINAYTNFENFELYTNQLFNNDCHNDSGRKFAIYNAVTGERLASGTHDQGARCFSLGTPYQTLVFPPLQLPYGTYFIHYHGGTNADWITDDFVYAENVAPSINAIPNSTVNEDTEYQHIGAYTDTDSVTWTGKVDYGDGSGEQTLTLNSDKTFDLNHTYNNPGTYTLTVTIRDTQDASSTKSATITVNSLQPVSTTFNASADTYVKSGNDNRNQGAGAFMRLQSSGDNRSLVKFDQSTMQAQIGNKQVLSAKLRVTITDNGNNWGTTGRPIDIHRLIVDWAEGNGTENDRGTGSGATWNCATDSFIQNQAKDCSGTTEWQMGQPNNPSVHPWVETATATQTITNNQTGVVEFDVTGDVSNFLNSTNQNYGWIIKKTQEGQNGQVSFGTKESSSGPQLVVTYQP